LGHDGVAIGVESGGRFGQGQLLKFRGRFDQLDSIDKLLLLAGGKVDISDQKMLP